MITDEIVSSFRNTYLMAAKQSLSVTHPELAKQAVGWNASEFTSGSNLKKSWACRFGHQWDAAISSRTSGSGCPYCSGRSVLIGKNDLATLEPEIASQAFNWDPATVSRSSRVLREWLCEIGHRWMASVDDRTSGRGCPICAGKQVLVGFNDLATSRPDLAVEAFVWDPRSVTSGSNTLKTWKCEMGHHWRARVSHRSRGTGCPICAGKQVLVGFNDLATSRPDLAVEAFGWDPASVTSGSNARKKWKCKVGHDWITSISNRTAGSNCPVCAGHVVVVGFNDLTTVEPGIAKEAFGWDPATVTSGAGIRKEWQCEFGHRWFATVASRSAGRGCPVCAGRQVLAGFNDLGTLEPGLAQEAFGWDPATVTRRTGIRKEWQCEFHHRWIASVASRTAGSGCPTCAFSGFDPNSKGWLYLLTHPLWEMLQVGITNHPAVRLKSHERLGWELIEIRGPMDGLLARGWETSILQMLKRHGAKLAPNEVAGKFDGYTEAWMTKTFNVESLEKLMYQVTSDEERASIKN